MNYLKLKELAPDKSFYAKIDGKMVFVPLGEILVDVLTLLDEKDEIIGANVKKIEELNKAFRTMEIALRQKGVKL
jgi:hypothetical protein